MAKEAYFLIDCERTSESIGEVIALFNRAGWKWANNDGNVEYVPEDDDLYEWTEKSISEEELMAYVLDKEKAGQQVVLHLFDEQSDAGVTFIAKSTKEIMLGLDINVRRNVDGSFDRGWYDENLIARVRQQGCGIDGIEYQEYEG